ncbi:guanylyl cyclase [Desulfosarcina widdelii]|uniref:Guanylyl cyclase n=1 Tax=Desulfosarcina widdelii TaxID=947919 RepID=A0A5K7Z9Q2_9BACT|nr:adenylate/guanylate cyclase domain-containing protein [Desulfosarcina widdelii]BBO78752.1 guanylyl cyclase [Desulfosarcina widdelii]
MANKGIQRKLKVIFSADVNGYSKLMGYDEEYTVDKITAYRDTIALLIKNNYGRVVDAPGDNLLAEFDSSLDAIHSAIEIQRTLKTENGKLPDNRRMDFRIGINMGDVLHKDDRIYGHSVNIAARIENLADPGGICISKGVHDQVEGKLDLGFADLGPHSVKNIEKPVRIYKVLLNQGDTGKVVKSAKSKASIGRWIVVTAIALAVAVAGAGVWYQQLEPKLEPASMDRMAYPLPDKPSIAVLPFENHSDDAKLNFFASGLTEDLTASLSKAPDLFVISRSSAAIYKGKSFDFKQVAEEQGIQYVMEGSVRKEKDKLRITVQLIDAINGHNLWADRFDRRAKEIFALQDEIVKHVMVELQVELTQGASARVASRGTDNLDAWLLKIEAHGEFATFTREGMIRARELYEDSHNADPNWARPLAGLASVDWYEAKQGWSVSKEASIQSGIELAQQAIEMDPDEPQGYQTLGNLYALTGQGERAIALRRKAVELAPNDLAAVAGLATRLKDFGAEQEAVKLFEQAMRLSPKHPWWVPYAYGVALHLVGRKEEAIQSLKKAIALNPTHVLPQAFLTAFYADLGRIEEARKTANEVIRLEPNFTANRLIRSHTLHDPVKDAKFRNLMHRAGLPE